MGTCFCPSLIYFNTSFIARVRFLGTKWGNHRFGKLFFLYFWFFEERERGHQKKGRKGTARKAGRHKLRIPPSGALTVPGPVLRFCEHDLV